MKECPILQCLAIIRRSQEYIRKVFTINVTGVKLKVNTEIYFQRRNRSTNYSFWELNYFTRRKIEWTIKIILLHIKTLTICFNA